MPNMMAAQSISGEERNMMDPIEQAALATERAASGIAEGAGHNPRATSRPSCSRAPC